MAGDGIKVAVGLNSEVEISAGLGKVIRVGDCVVEGVTLD
jgi:hypothetical protein